MKPFMKFLIPVFFAAPVMLRAMTTIECYQREDVKEIRPALDAFVHKELRQYPYLYVFQGENDYNTIFEVDPNAFVLFAENDGVRVGTLQANPLSSSYFEMADYTPAEAMDQIRKNGFDPDKILYITTFLMSQEQRSDSHAIALLFDRAVKIAKGMGKTQICYMEIKEDETHPLRPDPYISLEPWKELGKDFRSMDVTLHLTWPTLQPDGKVKDEKHQMTFFVTDI